MDDAQLCLYLKASSASMPLVRKREATLHSHRPEAVSAPKACCKQFKTRKVNARVCSVNIDSVECGIKATPCLLTKFVDKKRRRWRNIDALDLQAAIMPFQEYVLAPLEAISSIDRRFQLTPSHLGYEGSEWWGQ